MQSRRSLLAVLAVYSAVAIVLPTMADVSLLEDWMFAWSVEQFVDHGRLEVLAVTGPHTLFEVFWGGLFVSMLGPGFGTLRLSTLVLTGLSGIAFWELLSDLGVPMRVRSLVVAAYLFNPLMMSISYSFMSDPHAVALVVIALTLYVRGLHGCRLGLVWLGSVVASLGYLSRPQVLVVSFAVAAVVAATRASRRPRLFAAVLSFPLATAVGYWLWRGGSSGTLAAATSETVNTSFAGVIEALAFTLIVGLWYSGLFVAPIILLSPDKWSHLIRRTALVGVILVVTALLAGGAYIPKSGDWLTASGIGPANAGSYLAPEGFAVPLFPLLFSAFAIIGLGIGSGLLATRFRALLRHLPVLTMFVAAVAWGLAVVPAAFYFRLAPPDRYYLTLLPLLLAVTAWAIGRRATWLPFAWVVLAIVGLFSAAVVHDTLAAESAVWRLAERSVGRGVPLEQLSAGSAWDGFHFGPAASQSGLNDFGFAENAPPWWLSLMAPQIDPHFVIALSLPDGFTVIDTESYRSILHPDEAVAYLIELG